MIGNTTFAQHGFNQELVDGRVTFFGNYDRPTHGQEEA